MSSASETHYEIKTSVYHEIFVVKSIILIMASNTNDKRTHIECLTVNDDNLKSFPNSLGTYFYSILDFFSQTTSIRVFLMKM